MSQLLSVIIIIYLAQKETQQINYKCSYFVWFSQNRSIDLNNVGSYQYFVFWPPE